MRSNDSYGDAHMQLWKRDPGHFDKGHVLHQPIKGGHVGITPSTFRWKAGSNGVEQVTQTKKGESLPECQTKGVRIVPYSAPPKKSETTNEVSSLGYVKHVGPVTQYHGHVRECVHSTSGKVLYVCSDNFQYDALEKALKRQDLIDKG